MKRQAILLSVFLLLWAQSTHAQSKRDLAVRADKKNLSGDDSWFYDDLENATAAAAKTKRPMMIVFR